MYTPFCIGFTLYYMRISGTEHFPVILGQPD